MVFSGFDFSCLCLCEPGLRDLIGVRGGELGISFLLEVLLRSFTADDDCLRRPEFRSSTGCSGWVPSRWMDVISIFRTRQLSRSTIFAHVAECRTSRSWPSLRSRNVRPVAKISSLPFPFLVFFVHTFLPCEVPLPLLACLCQK